MTELCTSLFLAEIEKYKEEYSRFRCEESKPYEIGAPVLLESPGSEYGVILSHGFLASPAEVRPLADFLFARGFSVYMPRLPGHGTSPEDLSRRSWKEWYCSYDNGYRIIKECAPKIIAAGFSAGALLALVSAARNPERYCAVISLSAPVKMSSFVLRDAFAIGALIKMQRFVGLKLIPEYVNHIPDNPDINYFKSPVLGVSEVSKLSRHTMKILQKITQPLLVMQAESDPVISSESPAIIINSVSSVVKDLFIVKHNKHGILRGAFAEKVFLRIGHFLEKAMALCS